MNRHPVIVVLFVLAVAIPSRLSRNSEPPAAHTGLDGAPAATALNSGARPAKAMGGSDSVGRAGTRAAQVPGSVREAEEQGRYWRASRLLGARLRAAPDTAPATLLLASRLSAGWGDWDSVVRLLEGRDWLDAVEDGRGWSLLGRARLEEGRFAAAGDALSRYLGVTARGDSAAALAQLRRGLALSGAGEVDSALTAFDSAAALVPWFGDWTAVFAARAAASAGDTAEVRSRLADVSHWLEQDIGWRIRLQAATKAEDNLLARQVALDAARSAEDAAERAEAWATLGRLRLEGGDSARAKEAFRSAMEGAPGTVAAVDAARGLSGLSPSAGEWRMIGGIYLRHGNASRAAEAFGHYLDAGAGTESERQGVRLQLARALFNAGRYRDAQRRLLALADGGASDGVAAEALYLAGRAAYRRGRESEGERTFQRLAREYPSEGAAARGLYLLADLKHDDLELEAARKYYREAVAAAPGLNEAGLARMRLADLAIMDSDYSGAAELFEAYLRQYPDGRRASQATYWAARMYQETGRDSLARARLETLRERDPLSYYGARAAELLGRDLLEIPMSTSPPTSARTDSLVHDALRRVDLLSDLDLREDLVREVTQLRHHFSGELGGEYALAEALNERGYTLTGVSMGWSLHEREDSWNPRLLRIIYPFPFRSIVVPEAREQGLDPYLVAGLIRRESAFNPTIVSGAGAIGLMQIMPATGRGLARGAGLKDFQVSLLKQPEVNVHLGVRYLASLMKKFDADLTLVLSAYNAGPNRAVVWREFPERQDPELLAERIPYGETRVYIRHVLLHRALYHALYPEIEGPRGKPGTTRSPAG